MPLAAAILAVASVCAPWLPARAAGFPDRAITLLIPYAPGGANDIIARVVDRYAEKVFGRHFIFRYAAGAGGAIGSSELATTRNDGYTVGQINFPEVVAMPLAGAGSFQTSSFDYIARLVADPQVLVTLKGSAYDTLPKLIAAAKAKPGALTVAIPGAFDGTEFALLALQRAANVKVTMITFVGGAPQIAAILGKHVDAAMMNASALDPIRDQVNLLGVSTTAESPLFPGTKTLTAQGYPVVTSDGRLIIAPAGLPPDVLQKLRDGFKAIANDPSFQADMAKIHQPLGYMDGASLTTFVNSQQDTIRQLLDAAGLLKK
jgi:tripartite-type tricarboxylate transporter receptor subunit TctC